MASRFSSQNFQSTVFGLNVSFQKMYGKVLFKKEGMGPSAEEVMHHSIEHEVDVDLSDLENTSKKKNTSPVEFDVDLSDVEKKPSKKPKTKDQVLAEVGERERQYDKEVQHSEYLKEVAQARSDWKDAENNHQIMSGTDGLSAFFEEDERQEQEENRRAMEASELERVRAHIARSQERNQSLSDAAEARKIEVLVGKSKKRMEARVAKALAEQAQQEAEESVSEKEVDDVLSKIGDSPLKRSTPEVAPPESNSFDDANLKTLERIHNRSEKKNPPPIPPEAKRNVGRRKKIEQIPEYDSSLLEDEENTEQIPEYDSDLLEDEEVTDPTEVVSPPAKKLSPAQERQRNATTADEIDVGLATVEGIKNRRAFERGEFLDWDTYQAGLVNEELDPSEESSETDNTIENTPINYAKGRISELEQRMQSGQSISEQESFELSSYMNQQVMREMVQKANEFEASHPKATQAEVAEFRQKIGVNDLFRRTQAIAEYVKSQNSEDRTEKNNVPVEISDLEDEDNTEEDNTTRQKIELFSDREPLDPENDDPHQVLEQIFERSVDVHNVDERELLKKVILRLPQKERAGAIQRLRDNVAAKPIHTELNRFIQQPIDIHDSQNLEIVKGLIRQLPPSERAIARERVGKSARLYDAQVEQSEDDSTEENTLESTPENTQDFSDMTALDQLPRQKKTFMEKIRGSKIGKWLIGAAAAGAINAASSDNLRDTASARSATTVASTDRTPANREVSYKFSAPISEQSSVQSPQVRSTESSGFNVAPPVDAVDRVEKKQEASTNSSAPRTMERSSRAKVQRGDSVSASKREIRDPFAHHEISDFNKANFTTENTFQSPEGRTFFNDKFDNSLFCETKTNVMKVNYNDAGEIQSLSFQKKGSGEKATTIKVNSGGVIDAAEGGLSAEYLQGIVNDAQQTLNGDVFGL